MVNKTRKKKVNLLVTIACVVLPLLIAVVVIAIKSFDGNGSSSEEMVVDNPYDEALAAYKKENYGEAASILEGHWQEVLGVPEGCELVISVYALAEDMAKLEAASRLCMEKGLARGIAQEGFAFSMTSQGKLEEAIKLLETEKERYQDARIAVALARVYLIVGRDDEAGALFLQAISQSDIWSVWLSQALKQKTLAKNRNFITQLVGLILQKEKAFPSIEKQLLDQAVELGLDVEGRRLEERLMKVAHNEPT